MRAIILLVISLRASPTKNLLGRTQVVPNSLTYNKLSMTFILQFRTGRLRSSGGRRTDAYIITEEVDKSLGPILG